MSHLRYSFVIRKLAIRVDKLERRVRQLERQRSSDAGPVVSLEQTREDVINDMLSVISRSKK